jgi:glyoxylase-like metal-dependent hydrolase (beta-lactamase superfamily II)
MITRRKFTFGLLAMAQSVRAQTVSDADAVGGPLSPWSPGTLDIHLFDTGRGNATFIVAPDGTTLLIDCGASNDSFDESAPCRPKDSRRPGEWVARLALRHASAAGRDSLDYLIVTHIHPDHVGDVPPCVAAPAGSSFIPTGVSQVDALMPAAKVIDRGYPDYKVMQPANAPFATNYLAWLHSRRSAGRPVEPLVVGANRQIKLRSAGNAFNFSIRGIAANGHVCTGEGTMSVFPDMATFGSSDLPDENSCSIALRLDYGAFSYFTGGDLTAYTRDGRSPWLDVETPAVEACRRVEVAVADHRGYFDACGPAFTRSLDAQAYVIPAWHVTHPGQAKIERLLGAWPGAKIRDVFSTELLPANRLFNSRWVRQLRSTQGHVTVRVQPGGLHYRIFAVDITQEDGSISFASNLYRSRP